MAAERTAGFDAREILLEWRKCWRELSGSYAPNFSLCRRAIIHPEADASTNLRRPLGANVKLNGPQIGRVQGTFGWQPKRWVAVVWIEATNPSSCSRLYRECDRPRMTPKNAGTMPS